MRIAITMIALTAVLAAGVANANESERKKRHEREAATAVLGAVAILGIAAMAHHADHHDDGNHLPDAEAEAYYEQGYRDALYGNPYDTRAPREAYAPGYNAGIAERDSQRRVVRHSGNGDLSQGAGMAKRGCIGEASAYWGINPRDIHATRAVAGGSQAAPGFMIEVRAGRLHGICDMTPDGRISGDFVDGGRL